jgi:hypothetical protein
MMHGACCRETLLGHLNDEKHRLCLETEFFFSATGPSFLLVNMFALCYGDSVLYHLLILIMPLKLVHIIECFYQVPFPLMLYQFQYNIFA